MAKLAAILLPMALLQATQEAAIDEIDIYSSAALNIIGTDIINDVLRVYGEKITKIPPQAIPNLEREFKDPRVQGKRVYVDAKQGTLAGKFKLMAEKGSTEILYEFQNNVIYGKAQVLVRGMTMTYDSFHVEFARLKDKGKVVIAPGLIEFELTFAVKHSNDSGEPCTVTMHDLGIFDMKDFKTIATGFGSAAISRDINNIIQSLMSKEVLGSYMSDIARVFAARTVPHVFQYCKYVAPNKF